MTHTPAEEYAGQAQVIGEDDTAIEVGVLLRGHFQPIDGRFHWYGRIAADETLTTTYRAGTTLALRTPHGTAVGKIADVDPWGRFRITGVGAPPF